MSGASRPRNREQNFALNLLMDPEIDFVTVLGPAGTGKTLLALAAGLMQTLETNRFVEIIMTRVTIPLGEDIGFLPGTEEEKMEPWMGALMDNLEVLTGSQEGGNWGRAATNDLLRNRIKIRSLNFMRGRTFLNRFLILDEAQNLTPKQMKALTTRAGPGTKLACLGQHRPDRYALPYGDDLRSHVCRESLPRLGRIPDTSPWCAGSARGSPISPRTSCRCTLECVPQSVFVSLCKPGETHDRHRRSNSIMRRLLPALVAALLTIASVAFADDPPSTPLILRTPAAGSDLPDMGSPAAAVLSHTDEYRLGAMVAHQLRDQNALLEDPEVSEYMNSVGSGSLRKVPTEAGNFQYFVIKDHSINAFAVPGGFVVPARWPVLASSSESELAGVMAHETAHVTQHHIARMIADQSKQSLTTAAALLGAILLGAIGGGQAIEGGIAAAQGLAVQHQDQLHARQRMGSRPRRHRLPRRRRLRSQRDGPDVRDHEPPRGARRHLTFPRCSWITR